MAIDLPRYHIEYNFDTYNIVRQDTKTHIEIVCSCDKKEWAELIHELLRLRDKAIEANKKLKEGESNGQ